METFPARLTARKSNPATSVTWRPARAASTAASIALSTPTSAGVRMRPTRAGGSAEAPAKPGSISRMPSSTAVTSMPSGPTVSMEAASGYTPSSGIRPQVVFRPVIPQQAAGIRTEPPVSVPRATSASPVATATAEPLDEPPGIRRGSSGFGGVPSHGVIPLADQHNSVRLVLPTIRAPARRAAATTGASRSAGTACSAIAWQPAVVSRPSMSMQSLTASRGPPPGASSRTTQMESMGWRVRRPPVNLNALSGPSGNLELYQRFPLARLKVRNRVSERNEGTKPYHGTDLRARPMSQTYDPNYPGHGQGYLAGPDYAGGPGYPGGYQGAGFGAPPPP